MSSSDYCFLTYTAYRLLRRQVRWSSIPISLRIFHSLLWSIVKGSSVVNEAEVDGFLESPCFLYDPMDVSNLISGSSAFSKSSLYIWKFSVHLLLKPSLKDFSIILLACEMNELYGSLNTLGHCPSLGLEWKLNFSSPVAIAEFSKFAGILSAALSHCHLLRFGIAQLEFHHLP